MLISASTPLPARMRPGGGRAAAAGAPAAAADGDTATADGHAFCVRRAIGCALLAYGVLLMALGAAAWHRDVAPALQVSMYSGAAAVALAMAILARGRRRTPASEDGRTTHS